MSTNNKQQQLQPPTTNRKEGSETSGNQHFNTPLLTQQYLSRNTSKAPSNRNRSWKDEYLALPTPIREHFKTSSSERQKPISHSKPVIHYQQQSSQFCGDEQLRPSQMYPPNKPNRTYFPSTHHQQISYTNQSDRQFSDNQADEIRHYQYQIPQKTRAQHELETTGYVIHNKPEVYHSQTYDQHQPTRKHTIHAGESEQKYTTNNPRIHQEFNREEYGQNRRRTSIHDSDYDDERQTCQKPKLRQRRQKYQPSSSDSNDNSMSDIHCTDRSSNRRPRSSYVRLPPFTHRSHGLCIITDLEMSPG